ncbi:MAG: CBS domain-containing protein [Planctomycetota bacterium]
MSLSESHEEDRRYEESVLDSALLADPVRVLRPRAALQVNPGDPVEVVAAKMREEKNGCAIVVDDKKLVGIFTERDLLMKECAGKAVKEVMTADPECMRMDDTIGTALHKMVAGKYRNLPLVDESGEPAGVVTQAEAVRYLVGFFPREALNQPPNSVREQPPDQYGG